MAPRDEVEADDPEDNYGDTMIRKQIDTDSSGDHDRGNGVELAVCVRSGDNPSKRIAPSDVRKIPRNTP